ncbi:BrnA antitoxin family protein [Metallumcola ferriviriculae]|uniref:BrnA antitoxin family protein n=1 Tax=Metallumcola ferriviriculae TaxID=3039180 RepID=A0AAU0UIW1_9FIRM|nr:BrnA antitoxin family protein [Desulfitibacteraceae bacterium MK1]
MVSDKKIPEFDSVKEMAEFFDRTDLTDIELSDARVDYQKGENSSREMKHISIRVPKGDLEALQNLAEKAGVGYTTFVRMLIKQAISK